MPIRLRVALVFALALAVAFALGGWLFVSQLSAAMLRSTDAALAARLSQAGRYTEDDGNPRSPAVTRGKPAPGEYIIQIVDSSGRVTHASPDAGNIPLLTAAQLRQARHGGLTLTRILDDEPERIMATPVAEGHGSVAIAGISLESNNATLRQVIGALAIGGAVFVIVAGYRRLLAGPRRARPGRAAAAGGGRAVRTGHQVDGAGAWHTRRDSGTCRDDERPAGAVARCAGAAAGFRGGREPRVAHAVRRAAGRT